MPGGFNNIVPPGAGAIMQKFADLQRQINELRGARTLESAAISRGGISILDGGSLRVIDANGVEIARIGALPSPEYDKLDGTPQPGQIWHREDGSIALFLGDLNPHTPPFKQSLQLLDRAENVIIADDTNGGIGLAVPLLPVQSMIDTNIATWPATTAGAWTMIAESWFVRQNPGVAFAIYTQADVGTTASFRLTVDGAVVATSPPVAGTFAMWQGTYYWPHGWTFLSYGDIAIEAQVTAGTGTARAVVYSLIGAPSP